MHRWNPNQTSYTWLDTRSTPNSEVHTEIQSSRKKIAVSTCGLRQWRVTEGLTKADTSDRRDLSDHIWPRVQQTTQIRRRTRSSYSSQMTVCDDKSKCTSIIHNQKEPTTFPKALLADRAGGYAPRRYPRHKTNTRLNIH